MDFHQLGLISPILKALKAQGYTHPTPIQRGAIPPALRGRDVLGCAQTGTGKTCAFAAPILQRLNKKSENKSGIRALVLTPTRELALQIGESFEAYGKNLPLRSAVIFGGVGQQPQVDRLKRGVDILIATPGRLLDLHGQQLLDLSQIEIFVLDEADRMLDMGFIHDVRRILKLLPEKKQTLFFSATMPPEVMDLVNALLHNYVRVEVDPVSSPVEVIRQSLYFVDKSNKTKLLAHLIQEMDMDSVLVFSRTKHGANRIAGDLSKKGISAAAIHGNKSQTARQQALADFKKGNVRALIATDIAARGIDIDELKWVVNYDLPEVPETYVHRIGRTGRAGHGGTALSFCRADEMDYLKQIERLLGKKLPVTEDHPFPMTEAPSGASPMVQARQEARENARANRAAKAKTTAAFQPAIETAPVENKAAPPKSSKSVRDEKKAAPAEKKTDSVEKAAPTQKESKKGKAKPAQKTVPGISSTPAPSQKQEEQSVQPTQKQKRSRQGLRQGDLSATVPAAPSMPTVDFVRPDPLASDIIMDATARLLAPRKPIYAQPKPTPAQTKQHQKDPDSEQKREHHRDHKPVKGSHKEGTKSISTPSKPNKESPKTGKEPQKQAHFNRNHHRSQHKSSPPRAYSGGYRQKDSTEQKGSIIKPYYLSDD